MIVLSLDTRKILLKIKLNNKSSIHSHILVMMQIVGLPDRTVGDSVMSLAKVC